MSVRSRNQQNDVVLSMVQSGGKLMFYLGIFLLLLEVTSLFGATSHASRVIDTMAMLLTCVLLFLSVTGVRITSFLLKRIVSKSKESNAL